jgi:hypothetical protein
MTIFLNLCNFRKAALTLVLLSFPTSSFASDNLSPWINEIGVQKWDGDSLKLKAETAAPAGMSCLPSYGRVEWFDSQGLIAETRSLCENGGFQTETGFFHDSGSGFGFQVAYSSFSPSDDIVAVAITTSITPNENYQHDLSLPGTCSDFVSWKGSIVAAQGPCIDQVSEDTGIPSFPDPTGYQNGYGSGTISRYGKGTNKADFSKWQSLTYSSDQARNYRQTITWLPEEVPYTAGNLELAVLELPKPRNSVVKSLQDKGFVDPPKNVNVFKSFKVSHITDEMLSNDGDSTYSFWADTHRDELRGYWAQVMGSYMELLGSVRAENYFYDFDNEASSAKVVDVAQRRNLEAKVHVNRLRGDENIFQKLPFVGSGGGYFGMNESNYINGRVPYVIWSAPDANGYNAPEKTGYFDPVKNFDVSYWSSYFEGVDLKKRAVERDNPQHRPQYSYQQNLGMLHEYAHNWEAQHFIAQPAFASWRDDGLEGSQLPEIGHHITGMLPEYFTEYYLPSEIEPNLHGNLASRYGGEYHDVVANNAKDHDWVTQWKQGELDNVYSPQFFSRLVVKYGLNKTFVELYRRIAVHANWKLAMQQTFGRTPYQLYEEVAYDLKNEVKSISDLYLIDAFDTQQEFAQSLNMSYNVSFLQARSNASPNNGYRTLYTHIGDGSPVADSLIWLPVAFTDSMPVVIGEGAAMSVTSTHGQLTINGHLAFFYVDDTSSAHAGGLSASSNWAAFTRKGDRTSDLFFPVAIYDHDNDGLPDDYDIDYLDRDQDGILDVHDNDDDNDGIADDKDALPYNPSEYLDSDWDGIGDNTDEFPYDPSNGRISKGVSNGKMSPVAALKDMSGWSDKTICRLASNHQGNNQYIQEAKARALSCAASK